MSGANSQWISRSMKGAMAGLLMLGLSACAESLDTRVTRFQSQLPAPQGQTFAVVADDAALAGGIEFGQYAKVVAGELTKKGYTEVLDPNAANLIVRFAYGVDKGRVHVRSTGMRDPFWGPWYGPGFRRGGFYGGGFGGGFYGGRHMMGGWGYGWYDPWFDQGVESYTVYTSGISIKIDDKSANKRVFEGKAEAASASNKLTWLVPNLVEAFFTGFPGNSGETLRITVAPEKTTVKGPAK